MGMCWFPVDWEPGVGLAAPFVVPNWPIYVPIDRFAEAMPWISQHRGDLDVLMHPNSGCMRDDHEYNAMWSGNKREINLGALGDAKMSAASTLSCEHGFRCGEPLGHPGDQVFQSSTNNTYWNHKQT